MTAPAAAAPEGNALADVFASEAAFDSWYDGVLPRVFGYVYSRCGHDLDLAEELTQLTFVDAVRQHEHFDGRSDPVTWLCGIARHKLADHFRRLDIDERRQLRLIKQEPMAEGTAREDDIAERDAISRALASLPALHRAVLVFTSLDGLTVREAAALLDRSEGATESLLRRARIAFRRAYENEEGELDG